MASVKSLCSRGLLLENGTIKLNGTIDEIINKYLKSGKQNSSEYSIEKFLNNQNDNVFILDEVKVFQDGVDSQNLFTHKEIQIKFRYQIIHKVLGLRIGFDLIEINSGSVIFRSFHDDDKKETLIT